MNVSHREYLDLVAEADEAESQPALLMREAHERSLCQDCLDIQEAQAEYRGFGR